MQCIIAFRQSLIAIVDRRYYVAVNTDRPRISDNPDDDNDGDDDADDGHDDDYLRHFRVALHVLPFRDPIKLGGSASPLKRVKSFVWTFYRN